VLLISNMLHQAPFRVRLVDAGLKTACPVAKARTARGARETARACTRTADCAGEASNGTVTYGNYLQYKNTPYITLIENENIIISIDLNHASPRSGRLHPPLRASASFDHGFDPAMAIINDSTCRQQSFPVSYVRPKGLYNIDRSLTQ